MLTEKAYSSKKVFKKAVFNMAFQIVPIAFALVLTPYLINNMGKDAWAKYSLGISLIFLANYFSFGIGPTLNRRISGLIGSHKFSIITKELKTGVAFSYGLAFLFFAILQLALITAYQSRGFSVLQSVQDYGFFVISLMSFVLVLITIPYRSTLESFSDFYFLGAIRALSSSMLFIVPFVATYFLKASLMFIAGALLLFYVLVYFGYFLRVRGKQNAFEFTIDPWVSLSGFKKAIGSERAFLKETYYFSIFFLVSAIVLFFDRFFYPIFFDTETIADHVTLLDLFNRVAIVSGTVSLVYFSAISVWYGSGNLQKLRKNLRVQFLVVFAIFALVLLVAHFFLAEVLKWWLKEGYSNFISRNAFHLLLGVLCYNYTILLIRPLQAVGEVKKVSRILVLTTLGYLFIVCMLGMTASIEGHFWALLAKSVIDLMLMGFLLAKKKLI